MAITAYPLNNKTYSAEDAMLMNLPISSGIYADDDHFAISLSGGFSATISAGLGFIRYDTAKGFTFYMNTEEAVSFDEPDTVLSRIDRVVLRWDENQNGVILAVKKGTPSSTPVEPQRTTTSSVYELVLYDVTISANSSAIVSSNIVDQRKNPDLCGIMANNITNIHLDNLLSNAVLTTEQSLTESQKEQVRENIGAASSASAGTITGVSANGTSVATSGVADIPAATTSKYGVTKLSNSYSSNSTTLSATPAAVKAAYDLANKALPKAGGTMKGQLVAQNNTSYTTKQVRNVFLIAEGSSLPSGSNGDLCFVYAP